MKKLILVALTATAAVSVFAQGTVSFNNRSAGAVITHIYAPLAPGSSVHQIGNGSNDTAAGATDWSGYALVGVNLNGQYGGSSTFAQLLGANGANQPEASLLPSGPTTTFRTGVGAGFVAPTTTTFNNIPANAPVATIEMVAWDNSSGLYSTWTQASVAWLNGVIAAGKSGPINVANIGGTGGAPTLDGLQSFNLYFIPEPSTFALAGLGAAAMLIFRRRK